MNDVSSLDACIEEFLAAIRRGTPPDERAFLAAHPEQAAELRELLPMLTEMEALGHDGHEDRRAQDETQPDLSGSDYRLIREIGRGGMGAVWEALQISLNRKVAVKILETPCRGDANVLRERFAREAQIVAQLHHPNIVKVHGAGTCGNRFYYAMELVEGTRLDKFAFPDLRATVGAVLQAAQALAYAHRCGIIHRDVKPANLMMDAGGEVHVTDFGLATVLTNESLHGGAQSGTLRYMAPERLVENTCSFAADQYALGVSLWELIMRRPVFAGLSGSALRRHICQASVPPLEGVDADLAAVIAKSTRRAPCDRYRDMDAFAEDLKCWLDNRCVSALRISPLHRLALWARRKPAIAGLSAVAIACAFAFVAALIAGFVRTSAALALAARNAALADAALGDVFRHVEHTSASRRDAELLSALMPYYGRLAGVSGLRPEKATEVNSVLGTCAFRAGDYALAERSFRRVIEIRPSAAALNSLSETLRRRGRPDEADAMSRRVATDYARSTNALERYEAALALETLGRARKQHQDRRLAFDIARALLASDPANPDFRFLHARLLAKFPEFSADGGDGRVPKNACQLLSDLAADYPDRPEYSRALVAAMSRRLRNERDLLAIDRADAELALDTADRLIGRYPNVPDIVSAVIAFRDSYSTYLRKMGDQRKANRESMRTTGMLELLSHSAEAPDAARLSYKGSHHTILYRQIVVGTASPAGTNAALVLAFHDRTRNGDDNVRQTTAPFLRKIVAHAEARNGRTVILLPQCPAGRANLWKGAIKGARDGLLGTIADLARLKAAEFAIPTNRLFAVGVESGGDACWALLKDRPGLFARALVAGANPPPRHFPDEILKTVRIVEDENRKMAADNAFDTKSLDWLLGRNSP